MFTAATEATFDLIGLNAYDNQEALRIVYDTAFLHVVGSDSYYDYYVNRIDYWRSVYEIS